MVSGDGEDFNAKGSENVNSPCLRIRQPTHMRRLSDSRGGTLEHPEELTDRCCLSALAGLSKYLPLLGAGDIIAFWSDMSTLCFKVLRTL